MKRTLIIGLSLTLALSLSACGNEQPPVDTSTPDTPTVTDPADTSTPEVMRTATSEDVGEGVDGEAGEVGEVDPMYEEIYNLVQMDGYTSDLDAFEAERATALEFDKGGLFTTGSATGYAEWRLETHPLIEDTETNTDNTSQTGGQTGGQTSSQTSKPSGNTSSQTNKPPVSGSTGTSGASNDGSSTSGSSSSNNSGSLASGIEVGNAPSDEDELRPHEGKTDEQIRQEEQETYDWAKEHGITFGTG